MNENEQLTCGLLLGDEEMALAALQSQKTSPTLMIKVCTTVETTEGVITRLCSQRIETPLKIAKRLNMTRVVDFIEKRDAKPPRCVLKHIAHQRQIYAQLQTGWEMD